MMFHTRDQLAEWCREDGHPGCGDLIERVPVSILPSTLRWVARHVERNMHYRDMAARSLPHVLRENADWRSSHNTPLPVIPAGMILVGLVMLAAYLEHVFTGG